MAPTKPKQRNGALATEANVIMPEPALLTALKTRRA